MVGDAIGYHQLALSILSEKSFVDFDSFRTPGYPVFVALIYGISSCSVWFVLIIQILLSLISVVLVYKIATVFFPHQIGLLSAFLFAIDTTQAFWSVALYTDTLFVFLFLISVYYLCISIKENDLLSNCLSAFFLGIATLVRPISFLFPFIAIVVLVLLSNLKLKIRIIHVLLFSVIFLVSISPWLIHNYSKYGEAKLSSISGFNLLLYNAAYTEVYKTGKPIEEVRNDFNILASKQGMDTTNIHTFKSSQIYSNIAKQYLKNNFLLYCKRHFMGIINMYAGLGTQKITSTFHFKSISPNVDPFASPGIFARIIEFFQSRSKAVLFIAFGLGLYLFINYLFSMYGIFLLIKKKEKLLVLFILIILYFSALTGVVGYDRYRMPIMPFINILCAVGLSNFYGSVLHKFNFVKN